MTVISLEFDLKIFYDLQIAWTELKKEVNLIQRFILTIISCFFSGNELFSTATLKPERILILILEELQTPLSDPVSSLLIETNYMDLVCKLKTSRLIPLLYKSLLSGAPINYKMAETILNLHFHKKVFAIIIRYS